MKAPASEASRAAMAATPLTSMSAERAAAQIIAAMRAGRATVSPSWQSRAAQVAAAVAPNTVSTIESLANRVLPPADSGHAGDIAKLAAAVDPGVIRNLLPASTRRTFRQQRPAWS